MEIEMIDAPEVREEPATALAVQDRAALALGSSKTEAVLVELSTKFTTITEIKDKAGRDQAHGAKMELKRARTGVEKAGKAARDDATKFSKAVIAEEGRLISIVSFEEARLSRLVDDWDDAVAAEKAERERIAAAQKLVVDNAIAWIRNHAVQAVGKSSADINPLITSLDTMEITLDAFGDRAGEAEQCRLMTIDVLMGLHAAVFAQEAAAAEVEAQRIQLEKDRAEQERIAKEAAEKAEAEAKAVRDAEKAKLDEQRRAFQQEQADARAKSVKDAKDAQDAADKLAAERAAFEAEKAAKLAAEQKVMDPSVGIGELMPKDMAPEVPLLTVVIHGLPESIAQFEVAGDVEYIAVGGNGPSDADVIFTAARAVSLEYGLTIGDAIHRLAAVESWTQTEGETA